MYLQSKDLNLKNIEKLLEKIDKSDFKYMIQSSVESYIFNYLNKNLIDTKSLEKLILFSEDGELKILKLENDIYRCVYLGEKKFELGLEDYSKNLKYIDTKKIEIILWGENKSGDNFFVEQIMPHYFQYPVELRKTNDIQRVVLIQKAYINSFGHYEFIRNSEVKVNTLEELLCQ